MVVIRLLTPTIPPSASWGAEVMTLSLLTQPLFYVAEKYIMCGAPGFGISDSSVRVVLQAAGALCRVGHWPVLPDDVSALALNDERRSAGDRAIAADDVIPIVHGGALEVHTFADGTIVPKPIVIDSKFIRRHMIFAHDPAGLRHDVPDLLESLFRHPRAGDFVTEISGLALEASQALQSGNLERLVEPIRHYVEVFHSWSGGRVVHPAVREVADGLRSELGHGL